MLGVLYLNDIMIQHLKSFWRSIRRNKLYTAIHVFGFAFSLMSVILIGLYVQHERSVDNFHVDGDQIYRIEHAKGLNFPANVAQELIVKYPEIESTLRIQFLITRVYSSITDENYQSSGIYADTTFFSMFSFPFVEGNANSALASVDNIVLSESFAKRIFGNTPALGQTLKPFQGSPKEYIVSGVVKDFENTHLKSFDIIFPISRRQADMAEWGMDFNKQLFVVYLKSRPVANLDAKKEDMLSFLQNRYEETFAHDTQTISLTPLKNIYFNPRHEEINLFMDNDQAFITVLGVSALLILIFAVINYINLSMSQVEFRIHEVATCRILGAAKKDLFNGIIFESILLCLISMLCGLGLAWLIEPFFVGMMNISPIFTTGLYWYNLLILVGGVIIIGLISGLPPAMIVTRCTPIEVVSGVFRRKTKMHFSKILISLQYIICIVLIGCTIGIIQQVKFMQKTYPGYNTECIIAMSNPVGRHDQANFRDELMAIPGVEKVSYTRGYPLSTQINGAWALDNGESINFQQIPGDTAFMSLMNFEILYRTGIDDQQAVWLNETAWKRLGLDPEAKEFPVNSQIQLKLRGKIKDFHTQDYTQQIGAVIIEQMPDYERGWNILVKISNASVYETFNSIRALYNKRTGGDIFDGEFLDNQIAALYEKQKRISEIIGSFAILAIILSTLGMFAMVTYFMRQRMQDVAIRKVFGAKASQVLYELMSRFMKLVLLSFIVAIPINLYILNRWLSGYAYKINLSWTIFAVAGLVTLVIAGFTVLWQALKIALTNPAIVLKK